MSSGKLLNYPRPNTSEYLQALFSIPSRLEMSLIKAWSSVCISRAVKTLQPRCLLSYSQLL